jgi:molybdopterin converting factor small subunit
MAHEAQEASGHFTLLYFAAATTFTKKNEERLSAPMPLKDLPDALEKLHPGIKDKILGSCAVTINLDYVDVDDNSAVIQDGDEVAIIPPVSSG